MLCFGLVCDHHHHQSARGQIRRYDSVGRTGALGQERRLQGEANEIVWWTRFVRLGFVSELDCNMACLVFSLLLVIFLFVFPFVLLFSFRFLFLFLFLFIFTLHVNFTSVLSMPTACNWMVFRLLPALFSLKFPCQIKFPCQMTTNDGARQLTILSDGIVVPGSKFRKMTAYCQHLTRIQRIPLQNLASKYLALPTKKIVLFC